MASLPEGVAVAAGAEAGARASKESARERQDQILRQLRSSPFVSVSELVQNLGVSDMTIRRDLKTLSARGEVNVVHGGASLPYGTPGTVDFSRRAKKLSEAKRKIAQAAQAYIPERGVIAVDAGTTAFAVIHEMSPEFRGTVISHSIPVLQHMLSMPNARVLGLGGELLIESQALVGPRAVEGLAGLKAAVLFLGAAAVDADGVYVATDMERPVKMALIDSASLVVLVADHEKFSGSAAVRLVDFSAIDVVLTDAPPRQDVSLRLKAAGTEVVVCR
ncbi:glycerol-3-phosphate regulon repressor [Sinomonas cyclohexanicum]|uniref:Lactose phosphotransferase system repressor n=1 Tax=Sinomonas cyclohexanicum TaxID=322009 RepID=A0ABM7PPY0_SINCY|nr:glycerol-3-phosphate regulon repressor [Corynebacterium cyclohexanicum]